MTRDWKAIGAECRRKKICPSCRKRKAKPGHVGCAECIESAGARRTRWRKDGLCVDCRVKSKTRRCPTCQLVHQKNKTARARGER